MKPKDTSVRYLLSSSPHAHASVSVTRLMLDVILALLPTTAAGFAFFGWPALWTVLTCVVSAVATEALCRRAMGREQTVGDLSAVLTGLLLALHLPAGLPLWMAAAGSVFAIAIAKQVFGGLGMNPFNPALAARAFLLISFTGPMTTWLKPFWWRSPEAMTTATPLATQEQCVKYLLSYNPAPNISCTPQQLVSFYYQEGEREGIRPDVAFAQALKETGFFRYGGDVVPSQNNYCGLGTTGGGVRGAAFQTPQMGVRAHIQHLLAYASTRAPQEPVVDPRYSLVRGTYGDSTLGAWEDLNGRWAVPGNSYGQSILSMFRAILSE